MTKQKGATLIIAIVLLGVITFVAVITIEGTVLAGKQVSSSIFTYRLQQNIANEQMSFLRFYNQNPDRLLMVETTGPENPVANTNPAQTTLDNEVSYTGRTEDCYGEENDVGASYDCPIFELETVGVTRNIRNTQVLGMSAKRLKLNVVVE